MAKVQFLKDHKCPAPSGGCPHAAQLGTGVVVFPKQIIEIPDADAWGYVQSDSWTCADKATEKLADEQAAAVQTALAIEAGTQVPTSEES
jgi:hypothetical protein